MACGDAFGAPFEFHKDAPSLARKSMGEARYLDTVLDCGAKISRSRLPGLYTDDTQQALAMLWVWRQLVLKGRDPTDPNLFAPILRKVFGRMAASRAGPFGVHRGTGRNFRTAIQHGTAVDTAGMGAAMRIGPVATLWPPGRPYELVPWVQRVSEVTTTSQLAKDAAAMFASHIYAATNNWCGSPLSDMYPSMEDKTHWNLLQQALHILEMRGEQALLEFAEDTGLSNKKLSCAANGFALTGIPWVIGTVRKLASGHFSSVLTEVCRSGGDTDTVAAMAACFHAVNQWEPGDKPTGHIPEWMVLGLQGQEHILAPETWHPVGSEEPLTLAERDHRRDLKRADTTA